jgi:hypothetical protein
VYPATCICPGGRLIHSTPSHLISLRSILMLFFHQRLGLPNSLFPSSVITKTSYAFFFFPVCVTFRCRLDLITLLRNDVGVQVMQLYAFFSSFSPVTFHSTLLSNTLNLCSSLARDQVWHPHKTNKVVIPYVLIFTFVDVKREDKRFCTEWQQVYVVSKIRPKLATLYNIEIS